MDRTPRFSVVIPTYNRLDFLKHALSSIWAQTFTDYEVIVVDDGSTDATGEWLASHGGPVRVFEQPNRGPGSARNVGAREARGDYVAFLDSDDLWFPWTLDVFARAIQEHKSPHILGGKFVEFTDEVELPTVREEPYQTSWFVDYIASCHYPYYVGSGTCVVRREAFAGARFLEDRLNAEDHDLILQMGTLPGFVRILAPVTLAWRRHRASETGDFASSVSGAMRLLDREKSNVYPGGSERSQERHRILARHTRPTALACVRNGELKQGWELYRASFGWNIELGHWKYVLAFPILAVLALLSRAIAREPHPV
jgi:glycosyltransferase involved in cell wall biosynthesis